MGHLVNSKKQSSTVKSYISAIKAVLNMNNIKLNPDQYLLTSLTRACRVVNDRVRTRLPIKKSLLVALIHKLSELWEGQQPYLVHLYCTLFSTEYFGLFRVGELTLSPHAIKAINVQMGLNKRKILFVLDSSKTHGPDALPQRVKISSTPLKLRCKNMSTKHPQYCPYTLLRE